MTSRSKDATNGAKDMVTPWIVDRRATALVEEPPGRCHWARKKKRVHCMAEIQRPQRNGQAPGPRLRTGFDAAEAGFWRWGSVLR